MNKPLLLILVCSLSFTIFSTAQQIDLTLEHELSLPTASGAWGVAATPNGDLAVMITVRDTFFYIMNPGDEWAHFDYNIEIYSVGVDSAGLFALCKGNHIEKIYFPSGVRSEPVVYWPNISESNMYGYHTETNTYYRGRCAPLPPEPTKHIVVEGHSRGSQYSPGYPEPNYWEWDYDKYCWIHPQGPFSRTWSTPLHYLFDFTDTVYRLWSVEWEHSNALGWQYKIFLYTDINSWQHADTSFLYDGCIDYLANNPARILSRGICQLQIDLSNEMVVMLPELAAGQAFVVVAFRVDDEEVYWTYNGYYRNLFACNIQDSSFADELLCLNADELSFDVLSHYGALKGTTTSFEGNPDDIKLIAPRGPDAQIAVRDRDTLRIYSFGYIPMTPEDFPEEDPPDDPPDDDPPDDDPPDDDLPDDVVVTSFSLSVFPNPFNPSTTLSFSLPDDANVSLDVYNTRGQLVQSLLNQPMTAGEYTCNFDGSALSSGVYLARLNTNNRQTVHKLILLK